MPNQITVFTRKNMPETDSRLLDIQVSTMFMNEEVHEERWGKEKQYRALSVGRPDYYDQAGEMILFNPLPAYSYDIGDAWKIVEKINEIAGVCGFSITFDDDKWTCKLGWANEGEAVNGFGIGDTAPEAIARAAVDAAIVCEASRG